ncbi:MAG: lipoate--protein ligase [Lentisphaeria bacterium]|nr:lipoate--protein ligase [Lentisphaeria bacterium]
MELFVNPSTDPAFNLALEELLAAEYPHEFLMLWRNAPSIIVGRNQNTLAEIDADAVRALGIPVVRRTTGGGTVYHDLGNLNYTIAKNGRLTGSESFAVCAQVVVAALGRLGAAAEFSGRNDIVIDGRKISGSAKRVLAERTLFHGTMLFDADLSVLEKVLRPDEAKIRAKGIRSVRSRVMNLRELFPAWDMEQFRQAFMTALLAELGVAAASPLPSGFADRARELADRRYRAWEWNFGSAYPYEFRRRGRFPGGTVEVAARIENNRIAEVRFYGDFFGDTPAEELSQHLAGCLFRPDAIAERLAGFDLENCMHGVDAAGLAALFD